jgi:hypothetical protein
VNSLGSIAQQGCPARECGLFSAKFSISRTAHIKWQLCGRWIAPSTVGSWPRLYKK